jgi:hypothetical protein
MYLYVGEKEPKQNKKDMAAFEECQQGRANAFHSSPKTQKELFLYILSSTMESKGGAKGNILFDSSIFLTLKLSGFLLSA